MRTALDVLDASETDGALYEASRLLVTDYYLTDGQIAAAERELRRRGWVGNRAHGLCHETGHTHLTVEEAVFVEAYEGRYVARGTLPSMGIDRDDEFTFVCSNPQEATGVLHFGDNEHPDVSVSDLHYWLDQGAVVRADPG